MSNENRSESKPQGAGKPFKMPDRPTAKLKAERIQQLLAKTPGWEWSPDRRSIARSYAFPGLGSARAFADMANHLSREHGHPAMVAQLGDTVTCSLTSTWVNGLTELDFKLAQEINLQG